MEKPNADVVYALQIALDTLRKSSPKGLSSAMAGMAALHDINLPDNALDHAVEHLVACSPNDPLLHSMTLTLQGWDHEPAPSWAEGSEAHSEQRRELILNKLGLSDSQKHIIN